MWSIKCGFFSPLSQGMAPRGGGGNPPQCCWLSWSNPDWVIKSWLSYQILTELDHQKWPTLISCLIKEFELVKPQHWPTRVGHTSTMTDSSRSNLNIDRLESVKPQHWPSRVGQTSILTDSSWPNLNIDRLELVKPQHWQTRAGQTSTLTDSSRSNLNIYRRELVKFSFTPPPPPHHVPLEPSLFVPLYCFPDLGAVFMPYINEFIQVLLLYR